MAEITGRDSWIIARALAIAIETIEHLPRERQPQSDCEDMAAILIAMCGEQAASDHRLQARAKIERRNLEVDAAPGEHGSLVLGKSNAVSEVISLRREAK
jgi:hypothetical protein